MSTIGRVGSFFIDILETVAVALSLFVVIYAFVAQPHKIDGLSMFPNLHDKSLILTDKISYRSHPPRRGDVIVFHYPLNPRKDYVKRIIGLPGEKLKIEDNHIYIYNDSKPEGFILDEPYIPEDFLTLGKQFLPAGKLISIEEEAYFVMGDNREGSADSREFGPIHRKDFIGRAFVVYWPISEMKKIENPLPQIIQE
ncbi:signal peptidase I [candidate division WWE3 bacterium RIFCSPLOWO2_01_FULL_42_11]|uniref:Signal peptidase I n=1 Tax=candidate division WWE3 bacterium RIFCSPLOWO2_01_FULL_42_11 TaxID=1802627 RepID=A0A1F4VMB0_UNCKA|nr:MAG: signal peptidase I [candidate division WWE3 bacterium RIFCSPLOWO2_01_FULL_42_11]